MEKAVEGGGHAHIRVLCGDDALLLGGATKAPASWYITCGSSEKRRTTPFDSQVVRHVRTLYMRWSANREPPEQ